MKIKKKKGRQESRWHGPVFWAQSGFLISINIPNFRPGERFLITKVPHKKDITMVASKELSQDLSNPIAAKHIDDIGYRHIIDFRPYQ